MSANMRYVSPGGGGGIFQTTSIPISRMAYIVIGAGGAVTIPTEFTQMIYGNNGSPSTIYNGSGLFVQPLGGGGGGSNGASGGGAAIDYSPFPNTFQSWGVGLGTAGQGNNGGNVTLGGTSAYGGAGGGGGAGGVGALSNWSTGGAGGAGLACSSTDGVVRAGGGGGFTGNLTAAAAGTGGGGVSAVLVGANGAANTGGGGGGAWYVVTNYENVLGGNGGSGIVVIQYAGTVALARGGTITGVGTGPIRHTFTSSGIFTVIA